MRICSYPMCAHASRSSTCKMHRLPSDKEKCRIWMKSCRLAGTPRKLPAFIYICSCHYIGGRGPTKDFPNPIPFLSPAHQKRTYPLKVFRPNVPDDSPKPSTSMAGENAEDIDDPASLNLNNTPERGLTEAAELLSEGEGAAGDDFEMEKNHHTETAQKPSNILIECLKKSTPSGSFCSDFSNNSAGKVSSLLSGFGDPLEYSDPEKDHADGCEFNVKKRAKHREITRLECPKKFADCAVQCQLSFLCYKKTVTWSTEDFSFFVGISKESFEVLYEFLGGDTLCCRLKYKIDVNTPFREIQASHSPRGKLFMTLMRLRRGYPLRGMGLFFNMSPCAISSIFTAWVKLMSMKFRSLKDALFVSSAVQEKNKPECFLPFPNLRCIVDSTEIKIQKPLHMQQQSNTYSTYKGCNTAKFLVACSVYGGLSFISDGVEGSMSDRKLFLKSGILDHLNSGEAVMVDRGFDIEADLNKLDIDIIIPPFLGGREVFTEREMYMGKGVSTTRIYVEKLIGCIKNWRILRYVVPNTMLDILSDIVRVCAVLVNFNDPFVNCSLVDNVHDGVILD